MFYIQRQIQSKVFGVRFWLKLEHRSKDVFNDQNRIEFNSRHVQNLLKTYRTSNLAAVSRLPGDHSEILQYCYTDNHLDQVLGLEAGAEIVKRKKPLSESIQSKTAISQRWGRIKKIIRDRDLWKMEKMIFPVLRGNV
jgi:hypothetical protein